MIKEVLKRVYIFLKVPRYLIKNQIKINSSKLKEIESSIKNNYHKGWRSQENYTREDYARDLKAHLIGRLQGDRIWFIPWLDRTIQLKGANILEIGCGTGSSTIALAEQGANVTAIDIEEEALIVARKRCDIYNLTATFVHGNATDVYYNLKNHKYDLIIFYACIEHMVYQERIDCLRKYYRLLNKGSYLCIIETPNRLWYLDHHTSGLPFFHWLPDNLAYDYSKYSTQMNCRKLYQEYSDEMFLHFLRRGRGFSYHELEIALNIPAEKLKIVDYLNLPLVPFSIKYKFHLFLRRINPEISKAFTYPIINLIMSK